MPEQATSATIRIVATNHHDRTAEDVQAALVVGDKPTPPPTSVAKLAAPIPAPLQKPAHAPVSPQPAAPPSSAVAHVPAPAPPPPTVQAPTPPHSPRKRHARGQDPPPPLPRPRSRRSPAWKRRRRKRPPLRPARLLLPRSRPSLRRKKPRRSSLSFDGGECFLIQPLPGATKPHEYQAVGRAIEPFRRFDLSLQARGRRRGGSDDGADQRRAMSGPRSRPPRRAGRATAAPGRALKTYEVGRGQPLMGTISNLEGRRPYLVLVDNDGLVHRLDAKVDASGDSATFSIPLTPDASSVGPMQMLLAIVSDKPIPSLGHASFGEAEVHRVAIDRRRAGRVRLRSKRTTSSSERATGDRRFQPCRRRRTDPSISIRPQLSNLGSTWFRPRKRRNQIG